MGKKNDRIRALESQIDQLMAIVDSHERIVNVLRNRLDPFDEDARVTRLDTEMREHLTNHRYADFVSRELTTQETNQLTPESVSIDVTRSDLGQAIFDIDNYADSDD